MKQPHFWSLALLLAFVFAPSAAQADVAPPRVPGKTYVSHLVRVDGMKKHPGFSLLIYDAPRKGLIRAYLVFDAKTPAQQTLVVGRSWRSAARFGNPKMWLLPRDQQKKWSQATAEEISRQRTACSQRGEGCSHISRFSPRFAPPEGAIDCGVAIKVVRSVPTKSANKQREVVDAFRLVKATAKTCKVEHVKQAAAPGETKKPES